MGQSFDHGSRSTFRLLVAAPALSLLLYGTTPSWTSGFREDEVLCEEAKQHILDCCDPFTGYLDCEYVNGCGEILPDLTPAESRRIQEQSCSELRGNGTCERNFQEPERADGG